MSRLRSCATAIAVLLLAAPLTAQTVTSSPDTTAPSSVVLTAPAPAAVLIDVAPASAPSWVNALSVARVSAPQSAAVRVSEAGATPRNKALMVVGGAGLLVGAVVGGKEGTLIMGASGVIGLIGLWNYLK